ncbi:MAG: tryptophan-rich sensory protein, partial [Actinomycetota bacterium]
MTRSFVGTVSTIIVIIYIVGAGRWVSTDAGWYRSLNQPSWQPPDVVFGLIWPYNFAVLIIAGLVVASR